MAMTLYNMPASGHCHRVRLFLSILGLDYEKRPMSTRPGKVMPDDYRVLNPLGQVPTFLHDDVTITDSTAALVYLAKRFDSSGRWLPEDPAGAAAVQRWLSTASGELYRGPVSCRAARLFGREIDVPAAEAWSQRLFDWMNAHLSDRDWLACAHPTIADLAMYSYTKVAPEGGLELAPFPAVMQWLERVESLSGFEPMPTSV
ncbi:MAG: glutathione S-transferase N-terminal domain-containing protein [Pseudomonadota bacterium]